MPLPSRRDYDELRARLGKWLAARLPDDARPRISEISIPEGSGNSSETLMFDAHWTEAGESRGGRYVARTSPDMSDWPVFPQYDLELQHACLRMVARHSDVPVPGAPWIELDPGHIGSPFLVMERVDGIVPTDNPPYVFGGWVADASPEQRARLQRASVDVLARLHAIDLSAADAAFLDRPEYGATPLEQHLGYQRWYYDWARGPERFATLERCFDWLDAHRPGKPRPPVLNWGDSRIGNLLYRDFEPVAVLDWEMAALGAPEVDLAWMSFMHRFFADMAQKMGLAGIPGFMRRADLIAQYQELSGREVHDMEFWEVFAGLRYGIISIRIGLRGIEYGQIEPPADPEDLIMVRGLLESMLDGKYWEAEPP